MKRHILAGMLALSLCFPVSQAQGMVRGAGESYAFPTFRDLIHTIVMLGGLDLDDKNVVDEYARLMYCDSYMENYKDDFAWSGVRQQILSRIRSKREYYRTQYQIMGVINLASYDFAEERFPLTAKTAFDKVGKIALLTLADVSRYCDMNLPPANWVGKGNTVGFLPQEIGIRVDPPFTLQSLKMTPDAAEQMIERMQKLNITDRSLYIRLRFRIQDVNPNLPPSRGNYWSGHRYEVMGNITGVDLFYDRGMTQWAGMVPIR